MRLWLVRLGKNGEGEKFAQAIAKQSAERGRACSVLSVDQSSVRYRSVRPEDAALREAIKAVAAERRRFGCRRVYVMLERQGWQANQKKIRRLYREEELQVKKRGGRKRALGTRRPMLVPKQPNERWSLVFVSDAFTDGRRFRVLGIYANLNRATRPTSLELRKGSAQNALTASISTEKNRNGFYT